MKRKYQDQDDVSRYLRVDHAGELGDGFMKAN